MLGYRLRRMLTAPDKKLQVKLAAVQIALINGQQPLAVGIEIAIGGGQRLSGQGR
jgi:hypothetical protein